MKIPRYIVLHERVVTRFPCTVVDSQSAEPALWHNDPEVGRVPRRFRTQELAQSAADKLNVEQRKK
jgi:hypothetical protein